MFGVLLRSVLLCLIAILAIAGLMIQFGIGPLKSKGDDRNGLGRVVINKELKRVSKDNILSPESVELAQHSYTLDKRNSLSRFIVSLDKVSQQDYEGFFSTFTPLMNTDGKKTQLYVDTIAKFCADEGFKKTLFTKIEREKPFWGAKVLELAYGYGHVTQDEFLENLIFYPKAQQSLIASFISKNDWATAYAVFQKFATVNNYSTDRKPFNPRFEPWTVPPPFNWRHNFDFVDIVKEGLEVSYFGRDRPVFTTQYIPVKPGRFKLVTKFSGDANKDSGYMNWLVFCHGTGGVIAEHDVYGANVTHALNEFEFVVPNQECSLLILRLKGVPGIYPGRARIILHDVNLLEL